MMTTEKEKRAVISVNSTVSPSEGRLLFSYMQEVANNTAQIVRVNNSGPFPVHPKPHNKGLASTLASALEKFRLWLDENINYPTST